MSALSPHQSVLLSGEEIEARLEAGQIFRTDTWEPSRIRTSSYDLRIARDLLFIARSGGEQQRYGLGEERPDSVILDPGDTALFSTREKCCFPWDVGTFISTKWGLARQGLLVLTGGFVNPGFGLRFDSSTDEWVAADDERLHFFVVNVGDRPRAFTRDDSIASLTFISTEEPTHKVPPESTQSLIVQNYHQDGALVGLGFLTDLAQQRRRVSSLESRLTDVEKGLQPLISFGVYLVAAALLGIVATMSVGFLGSAPIAAALQAASTTWPGVVVVLIVVVGSIVALRILLNFVQWVFQGVRRLLRRRDTAAAP